jgi:hypothetical protein
MVQFLNRFRFVILELFPLFLQVVAEWGLCVSCYWYLLGLWLNWGIGMVMALLVFLGYEWLSF